MISMSPQMYNASSAASSASRRAGKGRRRGWAACRYARPLRSRQHRAPGWGLGPQAAPRQACGTV